ncbi:hypothetical protein M2271_000395 [Streptomyces sp. LBL]|nr:hypothetical protein [Streptomyces sp. LBL]
MLRVTLGRASKFAPMTPPGRRRSSSVRPFLEDRVPRFVRYVGLLTQLGLRGAESGIGQRQPALNAFRHS